MKITTKRYVVSTSALNCYGYRVLTNGIELTQFLKNPVLFWMHKEDYSPGPYDKRIPVGRAVEIEVNGDELSCRLSFSESNPFAMLLYGMYEDGTLNMLSLGAAPLDMSIELELLVEGQTGPTVTKCKAVEFSCVDIGGNDEALACLLYDADENPIKLSGPDALISLYNSLQTINPDDKEPMKLIQLSAPVAAQILLALKLQDTATEVDVQAKVLELVQLSATQKTALDSLNTEKSDLEVKLSNLEAENTESKITALVDGESNKYLSGQREKYIRLAKADFDGTKELLDGMPILLSVADKLREGEAINKDQVGDLMKLSYDELFANGGLQKLKNLDNEKYLEKRAEKFPVGASKK